MRVDNRLWGAPHIHGELLKLGFAVAQSTVAKYMAKKVDPSGQSWGTFLRNHMPHIAALDLLLVPIISFVQLYVSVIVRLARRELVWTNVTAHPSAEWIAQQVTEVPRRLCAGISCSRRRSRGGEGAALHTDGLAVRVYVSSRQMAVPQQRLSCTNGSQDCTRLTCSQRLPEACADAAARGFRRALIVGGAAQRTAPCATLPAVGASALLNCRGQRALAGTDWRTGRWPRRESSASCRGLCPA
jgi:hypothetical protein